MKNQINYYVIGGQYQDYCYGGTPTLLGAKRLANKNKEYWDNWQGWNTPRIYRADDCMTATNFYGQHIVHKPGTMPVNWESGQPECL